MLPGALAIYMEKPEIPVGKSNGLRHSTWETSENNNNNIFYLMGQFHAIWQLYKNLEGVFTSIEFQN